MHKHFKSRPVMFNLYGFNKRFYTIDILLACLKSQNFLQTQKLVLFDDICAVLCWRLKPLQLEVWGVVGWVTSIFQKTIETAFVMMKGNKRAASWNQNQDVSFKDEHLYMGYVIKPHSLTSPRIMMLLKTSHKSVQIILIWVCSIQRKKLFCCGLHWSEGESNVCLG